MPVIRLHPRPFPVLLSLLDRHSQYSRALARLLDPPPPRLFQWQSGVQRVLKTQAGLGSCLHCAVNQYNQQYTSQQDRSSLRDASFWANVLVISNACLQCSAL